MNWFNKKSKGDEEEVSLSNRAEMFQKDVDAMLSDVTRMTLPLQKKSFQCCTDCFDLSPENLDDITNCIKNCQKKPEEFGNTVQSELNQLQDVLLKCQQDCLNKYSSKPENNAEMERCAVKCYDSHQNMVKTIKSKLEQVYRNYS